MFPASRLGSLPRFAFLQFQNPRGRVTGRKGFFRGFLDGINICSLRTLPKVRPVFLAPLRRQKPSASAALPFALFGFGS
jgi:hypothetical protein